MVMIDCPWCDTAVPLGDDEAHVSCDACGVVVDLAADIIPVSLAEAA
jgi:hypothetical protein